MSQPGSSNPNNINPYQFTPEQKMPGEGPPKVGGLGSLAQASRAKQLNTARTTLIVIGIISVIANGILMALIPGQLQNELQRNGQAFNQQQMAIATSVAMGIQGMFLLLSVIFIICGLLVKRFPVPATVTALVLYIGSAVGTAALDPSTLAKGLIVKIIIVVALFKAVQAAFAYQKELQAAGA